MNVTEFDLVKNRQFPILKEGIIWSLPPEGGTLNDRINPLAAFLAEESVLHALLGLSMTRGV